MRDINMLIVHCAATPPDLDIGAKEIDQWHRERGWQGNGYHAVIRRSGEVEDGRPFERQGAHAYGYNDNSIGVVLVGGIDADGRPDCNFTRAQWKSLGELVDDILDTYGPLKVIGHRDVDSGKSCPCFSVSEWMAHR